MLFFLFAASLSYPQKCCDCLATETALAAAAAGTPLGGPALYAPRPSAPASPERRGEGSHGEGAAISMEY